MATVEDYNDSLEMAVHDYSFAALVFALIRKADSNNTEKIRMVWPDLYNELVRRYNAPGGYLPGEKQTIQFTDPT
jgi:hypothetical protein